jgi:hypothetical protein
MASTMKRAYLRDMFKKACRSVCTSTIVVFPDPFSATVSTSSAMKTPENTYEYHDNPQPADEGDVQVE